MNQGTRATRWYTLPVCKASAAVLLALARLVPKVTTKAVSPRAASPLSPYPAEQEVPS